MLLPPRILYLGDTALDGAAAYLAGILAFSHLEFRYIPSTEPVSVEDVAQPWSLYILSDYPSAQMPTVVQDTILEHVRDGGAGLLMIGGWESFHGLGGDWDGTPLAELLPVEIQKTDDRINFDQPALVKCELDHPITDGLPWDARPPVIGGLNKVEAKPGAETLLSVHPFSVSVDFGGHFRFEPRLPLPLLVTGEAGHGRTAAFLSDVAPHWVGGLVDWGTGRIQAQGEGAPQIEVGNYYAQFWKQLLLWVGKIHE